MRSCTRVRHSVVGLPTILALLALASQGCAAPSELEPSEEALRVEVRRDAIALELARRDTMPHGIAGDESLLFVTEPLDGRVVVLDRFTGAQIAVLPPPADGFLLPFTARVTQTGHLVIMDAGGFPSPVELATPRVYDYEYRYRRRARRFEATLVRSVRFDGVPIGFAEDLAVLDDGAYALSDSVLGALWIIDDAGNIVPAIVPESFAPADAIAALTPCAFPEGVFVEGLPFYPPGGFAPGVGALTAGGGHLYWSSTCTGGLWRVPLAALGDARAPHERAADIERVSDLPAGRAAEVLKGLAFARFDAGDDALYALDPFALRLIRIDVDTGARQIVADDPELFRFGVAASFLPPRVPGFSPLVVASDQEHRFSAINTALGATEFALPFVVTKVFVFR